MSAEIVLLIIILVLLVGMYAAAGYVAYRAREFKDNAIGALMDRILPGSQN